MLLFVPSTFLTTTSFFNFCNLNLFLAIIFLSINILVVLLSKSIFTVILSCISTFSTPMFSYTFFNILNILLMSFCLSFSCTVLFRTPVYVPLYCVFLSVGCATTLQFYYGFFFPVLYSGHRISLLSYSSTLSFIVSLFLHFIHCTLVISPLLVSSSLQFHAFWQRLYHIFFTCPSRRNPCS